MTPSATFGRLVLSQVWHVTCGARDLETLYSSPTVAYSSSLPHSTIQHLPILIGCPYNIVPSLNPSFAPRERLYLHPKAPPASPPRTPGPLLAGKTPQTCYNPLLNRSYLEKPLYPY